MVKGADLVVDPPPRCWATARCSWQGQAAPSCTTPTAGPGPPPGRWSRRATTTPRRCCRDGRVLVAGGDDGRDSPTGLGRAVRSRTPGRGPRSRARMRDRKPRYTRWPSCCTDGTVLVGPRTEREIYDPATGTWTRTRCADRGSATPQALVVGWHRAGGRAHDPMASPDALYGRGAIRPADRVVDDRLEHAPVRRRLLVHAPARWHGPRGRWQRL